MSFIISVQMKCTIQKSEKKNPKKQEREKHITHEAHTAARCVWVGVTAGKYSYCFSQRH